MRFCNLIGGITPEIGGHGTARLDFQRTRTRRPIGDFRVDLERPRDVSEIRMTPAFLDLHREIWGALKAEVMKGYAQAG
mgnify:CR=1 FL=1